MRRLLTILGCAMALAGTAWAQGASVLFGRVMDPSGAVVADAELELANERTGFSRTARTDEGGGYRFSNVPLGSFALHVFKTGFAQSTSAVVLRSPVPMEFEVTLKPSGGLEQVEVIGVNTFALLQPEATGTSTELSRDVIEHMPVSVSSRGLESVLLSFPGFAANANGAIHPRGAHNQMSYVIDGMSITDQLTGAFANSIDSGIVQTIELFTGNIPVEFGSKISGVAAVTTRSGAGSGRRVFGSVQARAGGFDTYGGDVQAGGESGKLGYFAAFSGLQSQRFLDQVSFDNLHNGGNSQRVFARTDYQVSPRDSLRLNLLLGRSAFELANLRSQQAAAQDQRQLLRDASVALAWTRMLNSSTTSELRASWRTATARLYPSTGDTPVSAAQARRLSTLNLAGQMNAVRGNHTLRAGADYLHFPVSESFRFAITSPAFNNPAGQGFIPTLLPFDLSRNGAPFNFRDSKRGNQFAFYAQDSIRWRDFTLLLGARYDVYRFLVNGNQLQPRFGVSYHIVPAGTVLRASYNRTYQTPVNENLLLSNSEQASVLVPASVRNQLGGAFLRIRPQRENVYELGVQQAIGSRLSANAAYYYKDIRDLHDNDNFFNTGIIFPTSLSRARAGGAEGRLTLLPTRGFSGWLSLTHFHVIVTPPFTGGLFLGSAAINALSSGPFVIDHDQKLGAHGMLQYNWNRNLWTSASVRYDSGLVSNPSDPLVVAADPDYSDLLSYVDLAGNPPRVLSRSLVDVAIGYERTGAGDRTLWDAQLQVTNLFNKSALYNFQSIFVGTRLVQPRTAGVKLRWHF